MSYRWVWLVVSISLLSMAKTGRAVPDGGNLLANPGFAGGARGWRLLYAQVNEKVRRGESVAVRLDRSLAEGSGGGAAYTDVKSAPIEHELRFSVEARAGAGGQKVLINAAAMSESRKILAMWSEQPPVAPGDWRVVKTTYVAPPGTQWFRIVVANPSGETLHILEPRLEAGSPRRFVKSGIPVPADSPERVTPLSLNGPGLIRAIERAPVKTKRAGEIGVVTFPIPGLYRDQVPLAFKVTSTPPGAIKSFRWRKRADGLNWVCEVTVAPGPKGALIEYEALVLAGDRPPTLLPKAMKPEAPDSEIAKWTRSTACVQSADPAVKAKAVELSKGADDVEAYARRVIAFTNANQGKGAPFRSLDAKSALTCGGSCTSRANLAAALLRVRGIPARTIAHLPTSSGPLYEHWLVEYWHPGAGWVWLESTMGRWEPQPWTAAVLNVANPEDEDKAFDPLHLRYVMPGAPYLAVIELSQELWPAEGFTKDDATNEAIAIAPIRGTSDEMKQLFAAARKAFESLSRECELGREDAGVGARFVAAAKSGKASDLISLLTTLTRETQHK